MGKRPTVGGVHIHYPWGPAPQSLHKTGSPRARHRTGSPGALHRTGSPGALHRTGSPGALHRTSSPEALHRTGFPGALHHSPWRAVPAVRTLYKVITHEGRTQGQTLIYIGLRISCGSLLGAGVGEARRRANTTAHRPPPPTTHYHHLHPPSSSIHLHRPPGHQQLSTKAHSFAIPAMNPPLPPYLL